MRQTPSWNVVQWNASQRSIYHYTDPYTKSIWIYLAPLLTCGYLMLLTGLESICAGISTLGLTAPSSAIAPLQQWTQRKISSKFRVDRAGLRIFGVLNHSQAARKQQTNLWIPSAANGLYQNEKGPSSESNDGQWHGAFKIHGSNLIMWMPSAVLTGQSLMPTEEVWNMFEGNTFGLLRCRVCVNS